MYCMKLSGHAVVIGSSSVPTFPISGFRSFPSKLPAHVDFMKLVCAILFVLFGCFTGANATGWRGIVPLHSTRSDVERLLGAPTGECKCFYETGNESIKVTYAEGPCVGYPSGWNVSHDTVLKINVRSVRPRAFSDLELTLDSFSKAADDTFRRYYSNRVEGIEYTVSGQGIVDRVSYIPSSNDTHLRCPCFPTIDESTQRSTSFDQFALKSIDDALARLDNYIIALQQDDQWNGYMVLYRGRRASKKRTATYRRAIMRHVISTRAVPASRINLIDGGYRTEPEIELFLLTAELSPPEPRASWVPCRKPVPRPRSKQVAIAHIR